MRKLILLCSLIASAALLQASGIKTGETREIVARRVGNTVVIGPSCSVISPCVTQLDDVGTSRTASQTASAPVGTGTVYFYIDSAGTLIAGHNLGVGGLTCTGGMTCTQPVVAFPAGAIHIATATTTLGVFDVAGIVNWFPLAQRDNYTAGTGIVITGHSIAVNTALFNAGSVHFNVQNGTSVIVAGISPDWVRMARPGTITGWELTGNAAGTLTVDVYTAPYATAPPVAGSIWGGALPAIAGAQRATSVGLAIAFAAGDYLRLNVEAAPAPATVTSAVLEIQVTYTP